MPAIFNLFLLSGTIIMLAVWGAGIFPRALVISTIILCFGACISLLTSRNSDDNKARELPWTALLFTGLIVILFASVVPLPGRTEGLLGSKRVSENNIVRETLLEAEKLQVIKARPVSFAMTRNRSGTLRILVLALAVMASGILSASLPLQWKQRYLKLLIFLMTLFAVAGFIHQWIIPRKALWWLIPTAHGRPVASFMCRTHYAGFIGMFCPITLAFFAHSILKKKWLSACLLGTAFAVMSFAVIMSLARGAVITSAVSCVAVILFSLRGSAVKFKITTIACVCLLGSALGLAMFQLPKEKVRCEVIERMETIKNPWSTTSGAMRMSLWVDSLKIWKAYPVTGVGADAFQMVYPQYRTRTDRFSFNHTENQYIQLIVDGGILGTVLIILLVAAMLAKWRQNNREGLLPTELSIAIGGAVLVVATHNAIDFPLYVPLYAIVFASIVGLTISPDPNTDKQQPSKSIYVSPIISAAFPGIAGLIILGCALVFGMKSYQLDDPDFLSSSDTETSTKALVYSPTSWYAWQNFGRRAFMSNTRETMSFGERCMTQATDYDKYNYLLWETLGYNRLNMWDHEGATEAFKRMKELRPWKKTPDFMERRY